MHMPAKDINKPSSHNPDKICVGKIPIKRDLRGVRGGVVTTRAFPTILMINYAWPNNSTNLILILLIIHFEGLS